MVTGIYSRHPAGETQAAIARSLNQRAVPERQDSPWTIPYVGSMLDNPVYAGLATDGSMLLPESDWSFFGMWALDRNDVATTYASCF